MDAKLDYHAAHRALSARVMSGFPSRERIAEGLEKAVGFERTSPPQQRGKRIFLSRHSGLQDPAILSVADSRVLMDPAELSTDGGLALVGYRMLPSSLAETRQARHPELSESRLGRSPLTRSRSREIGEGAGSQIARPLLA